jgi:hypothetical protein
MGEPTREHVYLRAGKVTRSRTVYDQVPALEVSLNIDDASAPRSLWASILIREQNRDVRFSIPDGETARQLRDHLIHVVTWFEENEPLMLAMDGALKDGSV